MTLKPFQLRIGGKPGAWKAMIDGKVLDLGDSSLTPDQAQAKLDAAMAKKDSPSMGPTVGDIAEKAGIPITKSAPPKSTDDKPSEPKPGEIRPNGLADLSPALLKKFRETFAASIADANYSVDKALFSIFGYAVNDIPEDSKALLKIGWELACQQYFVDGVPPPWVIILFANAQIVARLAATAKDKNAPKEKSNERDEKPGDRTPA